STVLGLVAAAGMSVASSWITTTLEVRELALVGVGSVVSLGIALVAALVGLSQPQPRRLKWLGLTPLIVSVVLLGCWLV
ncbi:MAG: hypothetical protein KDA60_21200, partial [Planctomycetales bacterium]|nr:hypothetical protein [Planctomycetales bacterium]